MLLANPEHRYAVENLNDKNSNDNNNNSFNDSFFSQCKSVSYSRLAAIKRIPVTDKMKKNKSHKNSKAYSS